MASFKYVCLVLAMLTVICIADEQMTENEVKEKPHSSFKPKQLVDLSNGKEGLHTFKQGPNVKVIYFYKRAIPRLRFFMKELEKSAEFLDLYGVKIGYCDCTLDANADIPDCEKTKVENNIYTFRSGNPLLSLELETMFDVNSIMSNILQLVLLREVPILQTPAEVEKFLHKHAGKHDVIFGHMKAIGTFDHRVFMEVAYAYNEKFKFAICTDKTATTLFEEPPLNPDRSSIWWVWTKDDQPKDKVYQSVQYKGDLNLAAFAKFAMMISFPKMFDIPGDGPESPYTLPDVTKIKFYYTKSCKDLVLQRALLVGKHYLDSAHILLINTDEHDVSGMFVEGKREPPVMCIQMPPQSHENCLWDLKTTDRLADFIETSMGRETSRFDDKRNKYNEGKDEGQGEDSSLDGRESLDINIDDVETQDDKIAEAVTKASKIPMSLSLVPALTDKTFPQTLTNNKIVLTLFYFPFDALSMANLRMLGDAADRLGVMTPVKVTRVNCHDWTDVCSDQRIIMYPTLRVFKGGEMAWDYKGPQDIQEMYSMMKLLELSPPIKVDDQVDMTNYLMGEGKIDVKDFTNTTVVGLFSRVTKQNLNEIQVFKQLVSESRDRILFVYSDDKTVTKMASQFGATVPAVILSKYGDTIQPHVKFEGEFNVKNLKEFVQNNKLPKLPVLTPLMFPELRRRGSDFVILFTDNSVGCQVPEDAVREVVKTQHFNNISFTMLPVEGITSLGFQVLDQYTTDPTVPYLSYVSLNKGEVFNFGNTNFEQERLSKWITSVTDRTIEPSTTLKEGEWKPLNKGYEFLKMMDYEQKEAKEKAKQNKKKSLDMDTSMPQQEEDSGEEDRGSIMENDEDTDTRKDLFDLNQSRLYHQAPGRGGDKHHDPASRSGVKDGMKSGVKDSMKKDTSNTHDPSEL